MRLGERERLIVTGGLLQAPALRVENAGECGLHFGIGADEERCVGRWCGRRIHTFQLDRQPRRAEPGGRTLIVSCNGAEGALNLGERDKKSVRRDSGHEVMGRWNLYNPSSYA